MFVAANKSATIGVKADGSALFAGEMTGSEAVSGWSNVYMAAMGGVCIAMRQWVLPIRS